MADIVAERQNKTAEALAEQAKQAEQDAKDAAKVAARVGATEDEKKKAAEAAETANNATETAKQAAELAKEPVTGAPATMSQSSVAAQCVAKGCTATVTSDANTSGVGDTATSVSHAEGTCTGAGSGAGGGCMVGANASATTTTNSGAADPKSADPNNPAMLPGRTGTTQAGAELDCPQGCTGQVSTETVSAASPDGGAAELARLARDPAAALPAANPAGTDASSVSIARGSTGCTGSDPCKALVSASGSMAVSTAADAMSGATSAAVDGACTSGKDGAGTCSVTTTSATAAGDDPAAVIESLRTRTAPAVDQTSRAVAAADCTSAGTCSSTTGSYALGRAAQAMAGCDGSGTCTVIARNSAVAEGATHLANADGSCTAAAQGRCATRAVTEISDQHAMAAAACQATEGSTCHYSYLAQSTDEAPGAKAASKGWGEGTIGDGQALTTAMAAGGPGWAQAAAACNGSPGTNCEHSYSATASASMGGKSGTRANASASGSASGGMGGGAVAVAAQAYAKGNKANAAASCSGAPNCKASFYAHAEASDRRITPATYLVEKKRWDAFGWGTCKGSSSSGGGCGVVAIAVAGPGGYGTAQCSGDCDQFTKGGYNRATIIGPKLAPPPGYGVTKDGKLVRLALDPINQRNVKGDCNFVLICTVSAKGADGKTEVKACFIWFCNKMTATGSSGETITYDRGAANQFDGSIPTEVGGPAANGNFPKEGEKGRDAAQGTRGISVARDINGRGQIMVDGTGQAHDGYNGSHVYYDKPSRPGQPYIADLGDKTGAPFATSCMDGCRGVLSNGVKTDKFVIETVNANAVLVARDNAGNPARINWDNAKGKVEGAEGWIVESNGDGKPVLKGKQGPSVAIVSPSDKDPYGSFSVYGQTGAVTRADGLKMFNTPGKQRNAFDPLVNAVPSLQGRFDNAAGQGGYINCEGMCQVQRPGDAAAPSEQCGKLCVMDSENPKNNDSKCPVWCQLSEGSPDPNNLKAPNGWFGAKLLEGGPGLVQTITPQGDPTGCGGKDCWIVVSYRDAKGNGGGVSCSTGSTQNGFCNGNTRDGEYVQTTPIKIDENGKEVDASEEGRWVGGFRMLYHVEDPNNPKADKHAGISCFGKCSRSDYNFNLYTEENFKGNLENADRYDWIGEADPTWLTAVDAYSERPVFGPNSYLRPSLDNKQDRDIATSLGLDPNMVGKGLMLPPLAPEQLKTLTSDERKQYDTQNPTSFVDVGLASIKVLEAQSGNRHTSIRAQEPGGGVEGAIQLGRDIDAALAGGLSKAEEKALGDRLVPFAISAGKWGDQRGLIKAIQVMNYNAYVPTPYEAEVMGDPGLSRDIAGSAPAGKSDQERARKQISDLQRGTGGAGISLTASLHVQGQIRQVQYDQYLNNQAIDAFNKSKERTPEAAEALNGKKEELETKLAGLKGLIPAGPVIDNEALRSIDIMIAGKSNDPEWAGRLGTADGSLDAINATLGKMINSGDPRQKKFAEEKAAVLGAYLGMNYDAIANDDGQRAEGVDYLKFQMPSSGLPDVYFAQTAAINLPGWKNLSGPEAAHVKNMGEYEMVELASQISADEFLNFQGRSRVTDLGDAQKLMELEYLDDGKTDREKVDEEMGRLRDAAKNGELRVITAPVRDEDGNVGQTSIFFVIGKDGKPTIVKGGSFGSFREFQEESEYFDDEDVKLILPKKFLEIEPLRKGADGKYAPPPAGERLQFEVHSSHITSDLEVATDWALTGTMVVLTVVAIGASGGLASPAAGAMWAVRGGMFGARAIQMATAGTTFLRTTTAINSVIRLNAARTIMVNTGRLMGIDAAGNLVTRYNNQQSINPFTSAAARNEWLDVATVGIGELAGVGRLAPLARSESVYTKTQNLGRGLGHTAEFFDIASWVNSGSDLVQNPSWSGLAGFVLEGAQLKGERITEANIHNAPYGTILKQASPPQRGWLPSVKGGDGASMDSRVLDYLDTVNLGADRVPAYAVAKRLGVSQDDVAGAIAANPGRGYGNQRVTSDFGTNVPFIVMQNKPAAKPSSTVRGGLGVPNVAPTNGPVGGTPGGGNVGGGAPGQGAPGQGVPIVGQGGGQGGPIATQGGAVANQPNNIPAPVQAQGGNAPTATDQQAQGAPLGAVPGNSPPVQNAAVPNAAVPNAVVPNPNAAVPNAAVPNAAVPNAAVPNAAVPNAAVPNGAVPNPATVDPATPAGAPVVDEPVGPGAVEPAPATPATNPASGAQVADPNAPLAGPEPVADPAGAQQNPLAAGGADPGAPGDDGNGDSDTGSATDASAGPQNGSGGGATRHGQSPLAALLSGLLGGGTPNGGGLLGAIFDALSNAPLVLILLAGAVGALMVVQAVYAARSRGPPAFDERWANRADVKRLRKQALESPNGNGVIVATNDDQLQTFGKYLWTDTPDYLVVVHSDEQGAYVLVEGDKLRLTAGQLAALLKGLRSFKNWQKNTANAKEGAQQPRVVVVACGLGACSFEMEQLQQQLDASIVAPSTGAWVHEPGSTGRATVSLDEGGGWLEKSGAGPAVPVPAPKALTEPGFVPGSQAFMPERLLPALAPSGPPVRAGDTPSERLAKLRATDPSAPEFWEHAGPVLEMIVRAGGPADGAQADALRRIVDAYVTGALRGGREAADSHLPWVSNALGAPSWLAAWWAKASLRTTVRQIFARKNWFPGASALGVVGFLTGLGVVLPAALGGGRQAGATTLNGGGGNGNGGGSLLGMLADAFGNAPPGLIGLAVVMAGVLAVHVVLTVRARGPPAWLGALLGLAGAGFRFLGRVARAVFAVAAKAVVAAVVIGVVLPAIMGANVAAAAAQGSPVPGDPAFWLHVVQFVAENLQGILQVAAIVLVPAVIKAIRVGLTRGPRWLQALLRFPGKVLRGALEVVRALALKVEGRLYMPIVPALIAAGLAWLLGLGPSWLSVLLPFFFMFPHAKLKLADGAKRGVLGFLKAIRWERAWMLAFALPLWSVSLWSWQALPFLVFELAGAGALLAGIMSTSMSRGRHEEFGNREKWLGVFLPDARLMLVARVFGLYAGPTVYWFAPTPPVHGPVAGVPEPKFVGLRLWQRLRAWFASYDKGLSTKRFRIYSFLFLTFTGGFTDALGADHTVWDARALLLELTIREKKLKRLEHDVVIDLFTGPTRLLGWLVFKLARGLVKIAPGRLGSWLDTLPDRWANRAFVHLVEHAQRMLVLNLTEQSWQRKQLDRSRSKRRQQKLAEALAENQKRAREIEQVLDGLAADFEKRLRARYEARLQRIQVKQQKLQKKAAARNGRVSTSRRAALVAEAARLRAILRGITAPTPTQSKKLGKAIARKAAKQKQLRAALDELRKQKPRGKQERRRHNEKRRKLTGAQREADKQGGALSRMTGAGSPAKRTSKLGKWLRRIAVVVAVVAAVLLVVAPLAGATTGAAAGAGAGGVWMNLVTFLAAYWPEIVQLAAVAATPAVIKAYRVGLGRGPPWLQKLLRFPARVAGGVVNLIRSVRLRVEGRVYSPILAAMFASAVLSHLPLWLATVVTPVWFLFPHVKTKLAGGAGPGLRGFLRSIRWERAWMLALMLPLWSATWWSWQALPFLAFEIAGGGALLAGFMSTSMSRGRHEEFGNREKWLGTFLPDARVMLTARIVDFYFGPTVYWFAPTPPVYGPVAGVPEPKFVGLRLWQRLRAWFGSYDKALSTKRPRLYSFLFFTFTAGFVDAQGERHVLWDARALVKEFVLQEKRLKRLDQDVVIDAFTGPSRIIGWLVFKLARGLVKIAPGRLGSWLDTLPDRWANRAFVHLVEHAQRMLVLNLTEQSWQRKQLDRSRSKRRQQKLAEALAENQKRAREIEQVLDGLAADFEKRLRARYEARLQRIQVKLAKLKASNRKWQVDRRAKLIAEAARLRAVLRGITAPSAPQSRVLAKAIARNAAKQQQLQVSLDELRKQKPRGKQERRRHNEKRRKLTGAQREADKQGGALSRMTGAGSPVSARKLGKWLRRIAVVVGLIAAVILVLALPAGATVVAGGGTAAAAWSGASALAGPALLKALAVVMAVGVTVSMIYLAGARAPPPSSVNGVGGPSRREGGDLAPRKGKRLAKWLSKLYRAGRTVVVPIAVRDEIGTVIGTMLLYPVRGLQAWVRKKLGIDDLVAFAWVGNGERLVAVDSGLLARIVRIVEVIAAAREQNFHALADRLQRMLDGWLADLHRHENVHFEHPDAAHDEHVFDGHRDVRHELLDQAAAFAEYVERRIAVRAASKLWNTRRTGAANDLLRDLAAIHDELAKTTTNKGKRMRLFSAAAKKIDELDRMLGRAATSGAPAPRVRGRAAQRRAAVQAALDGWARLTDPRLGDGDAARWDVWRILGALWSGNGLSQTHLAGVTVDELVDLITNVPADAPAWVQALAAQLAARGIGASQIAAWLDELTDQQLLAKQSDGQGVDRFRPGGELGRLLARAPPAVVAAFWRNPFGVAGLAGIGSLPVADQAAALRGWLRGVVLAWGAVEHPLWSIVPLRLRGVAGWRLAKQVRWSVKASRVALIAVVNAAEALARGIAAGVTGAELAALVDARDGANRELARIVGEARAKAAAAGFGARRVRNVGRQPRLLADYERRLYFPIIQTVVLLVIGILTSPAIAAAVSVFMFIFPHWKPARFGSVPLKAKPRWWQLRKRAAGAGKAVKGSRYERGGALAWSTALWSIGVVVPLDGLVALLSAHPATEWLAFALSVVALKFATSGDLLIGRVPDPVLEGLALPASERNWWAGALPVYRAGGSLIIFGFVEIAFFAQKFKLLATAFAPVPGVQPPAMKGTPLLWRLVSRVLSYNRGLFSKSAAHYTFWQLGVGIGIVGGFKVEPRRSMRKLILRTRAKQRKTVDLMQGPGRLTGKIVFAVLRGIGRLLPAKVRGFFIAVAAWRARLADAGDARQAKLMVAWIERVRSRQQKRLDAIAKKLAAAPSPWRKKRLERAHAKIEKARADNADRVAEIQALRFDRHRTARAQRMMTRTNALVAKLERKLAAVESKRTFARSARRADRLRRAHSEVQDALAAARAEVAAIEKMIADIKAAPAGMPGSWLFEWISKLKGRGKGGKGGSGGAGPTVTTVIVIALSVAIAIAAAAPNGSSMSAIVAFGLLNGTVRTSAQPRAPSKLREILQGRALLRLGVVTAVVVAVLVGLAPLAVAATTVTAAASSGGALALNVAAILHVAAIAATPLLVRLGLWLGRVVRRALAGAGSVRGPTGAVAVSEALVNEALGLPESSRSLLTFAALAAGVIGIVGALTNVIPRLMKLRWAAVILAVAIAVPFLANALPFFAPVSVFWTLFLSRVAIQMISSIQDGVARGALPEDLDDKARKRIGAIFVAGRVTAIGVGSLAASLALGIAEGMGLPGVVGVNVIAGVAVIAEIALAVVVVRGRTGGGRLRGVVKWLGKRWVLRALVVTAVVVGIMLAKPLVAVAAVQAAGQASALDLAGIGYVAAIAATPLLMRLGQRLGHRLGQWLGPRVRGALAGAGSVRSPTAMVRSPVGRFAGLLSPSLLPFEGFLPRRVGAGAVPAGSRWAWVAVGVAGAVFVVGLPVVLVVVLPAALAVVSNAAFGLRGGLNLLPVRSGPTGALLAMPLIGTFVVNLLVLVPASIVGTWLDITISAAYSATVAAFGMSAVNRAYDLVRGGRGSVHPLISGLVTWVAFPGISNLGNVLLAYKLGWVAFDPVMLAVTVVLTVTFANASIVGIVAAVRKGRLSDSYLAVMGAAGNVSLLYWGLLAVWPRHWVELTVAGVVSAGALGVAKLVAWRARLTHGPPARALINVVVRGLVAGWLGVGLVVGSDLGRATTIAAISGYVTVVALWVLHRLMAPRPVRAPVDGRWRPALRVLVVLVATALMMVGTARPAWAWTPGEWLMAHPGALWALVAATPVALSVMLLLTVRAIDRLGWTRGNAPPPGPDAAAALAAVDAAAAALAVTDLEPVARIRLVSRLREHLRIRVDDAGAAELRSHDGGLELALPQPEFELRVTALRVVELVHGARLGERRRAEIATWVLTLTAIVNHLATAHSSEVAAAVARQTYGGLITALPAAARAPVLAMLGSPAAGLEPGSAADPAPAPRRPSWLAAVVRAVAGLVAGVAGFWLAVAGVGPVVVVVGAAIGGLVWLVAGDTPAWLRARVDQALVPLARRSSIVRWAGSPSNRPVLRLVIAVAFGLAGGAVVHTQLHLGLVTAAVAVPPGGLRAWSADAPRAPGRLARAVGRGVAVVGIVLGILIAGAGIAHADAGGAAATGESALLWLSGGAAALASALLSDLLALRSGTRTAILRRIGAALLGGAAAAALAVSLGGSAVPVAVGAVAVAAGLVAVRMVLRPLGGATARERALREMRVRLVLMRGRYWRVSAHYRVRIRPTVAQLEHLRWYVTSGYTALNGWLRGLDPFGGAHIERMQAELEALFARYALPVSLRVERMVNDRAVPRTYLPGDVYVDPAVLSTSAVKAPVNKTTSLTVLVPAGMPVIRPLRVGAPRREREVLLPPGTRLMVLEDRPWTDRTRSKVRRRISMVAVPPALPGRPEDPWLLTPEAVAVLARHGVAAWRALERP
ncbi:hypothetical protein [Pseudonocardia sp. TRM90224]|uniref:hypothetical protein n=1 Tax=Pseudonocardia sp. TRM90224 TaxID=2812678 RepID=UPI001E56D374|nr:hypothetical protein [Pseudonocardia sp. TRM90224]